jgi:PAS domain S-box-containing protein
VKELINLHGGTIHAESEPGKGTSFIVSIPTGRRHIPADRTGAERTLSSATPVAEAYIEEAMRWIPGESESVKVEPGASTHSPPRLIDQSPSRILLADDNYDMREYVKRILSSRWTVEAVSDGKSVLEAARAHAPDLILSDVMMPGLNGFELLRELRSDPRTRKVPVILLSARAGEESRIEGLEAGADDYLVKPFSARELVARVESNLKLQRLRLEATELEAALRAEAERRAREAEEKQKILETLLAHVPEGITMVAGPPDFPIVANSRMAEELIGRPAATLRDIPVGQHAESYGIFLKDGVTGPRPEQLPLYRAMHYGETITDEEWVIKRPDGESITVVVNVVPIRDSRGSIIGALNCWRDITERKRTEEALRESEELLQTMTRSVPSIIWSATADGRITFHNRQWLEYTGLTPAENEQDWATRVLHPDDYERCIKAWQNALATGEDYAIEIRNRRADGVYRWFLTRAVPHRDSTGQIVSWFGSTTDIHDNKLTEEKLRQSEERFRQAADAANALIYEVDLLSGETAVVYGLERVTGYDPGETIATSGWWHSLIHPEDLPGHLSQLKRNLERGGAYLTEYRIRHKDGSWRNVQDNGLATQNSDGKTIRLVGAITDITDRKRAEEERERILAAEREAREAADSASRAKDEFLATISHELRTPLNAMFGWARLLSERRLDDETMARGLKSIGQNAKAQAQLIEDLLDVSRIISGKFRLKVEPVQVARVIEAAIDSVRPAADAKEVSLEISLDPDAGPVSGDAGRLQQVVWNLLSNGVKFTPKGGRVQVRLSRKDTYIEIEVSDNGQGIKLEFLPFVFDRFRQADGSTTRAHGGLGLGLAIVRHITELHGGSVAADSPGIDRGATFTVRLPLMTTQSKPGEGKRDNLSASSKVSHARGQAQSLDGVKVLIVDDDLEALLLLSTALTHNGAYVKTASSAEEGFTHVKEWRPDVIVSDIGMPSEDGYSFIKQVRAWSNNDGGSIPAVALTAYASANDRMKAIDSGYQIHLSKPVEPLELIAAVAGLTGRGYAPSAGSDLGAEGA